MKCRLALSHFIDFVRFGESQISQLTHPPSTLMAIACHCLCQQTNKIHQNPTTSHALKIVQTAVKGLTMDEGFGNWFHLHNRPIQDPTLLMEQRTERITAGP
jgi:hypothetical protein